MTDALFPLPLTPFETYYWCDDRPAAPTTFPIELTFRGTLRRSEFERAVRGAVARHPLLHALVDAQTMRRPRWIDAADRSAPIDWADVSEPIRLSPVAFLDLTAVPGLRAWIRLSSEQSRVVFQIHHACCDALGALQFIEELLVIYDALVKGSPPEARLRPLNPRQLTRRGDYGLSAANYRPGLKDAWITARIWGRTLLRRPSLVAATRMSANESPSGDDGRPYLTETLCPEVMEGLHQAARRAGTTVNDLMLRDLFLVLQRWNAEHQGSGRHRITINIPVSLRSRADAGMPAANSLGFWFVHRAAADCAHPAALLASIREETNAVKKWRMPLYFIGGLGVAARIPGLMRWMLNGKRSFATAVFSNVGRVFSRTPLERANGCLVCGDAILERVSGVPPVRHGTRIAIAVATYGRETTINLRSDPSEFPPSDACRLLTQFFSQLLKSSGV